MANVRGSSRIVLPAWCVTCNTQHTVDEACPGRLLPVEPERHGWRVNADTARGIDAYGVLLARCTEFWRARILTYPNVLWLVPGGSDTIKFAGLTVGEAEQKAANYIKAHCRRRGYELRAELSPVAFSGVDPEDGQRKTVGARPAQRKIRFLPVRFGVGGATEPGGTGNLSESGIFIITNSPVDEGKRVSLALSLEDNRIMHLSGDVVWMRKEHHVGRSPGMGVHLDAPPVEYLDYVSRLA